MDQDRSYSSYYGSRSSRHYEEPSNWRRGSASWDAQWSSSDRYSNSDYYNNYSRPDSVHNNYNESCSRYEEEHPKNSYELDPRTMEFDRLVELLHPKFISEYLNKILTFLKSNNTEISFPHIAPYKEAFLVRIASDHRNLECAAFDDTCQSISRNIRDFLYRNSKDFVWSCAYESGNVSKNVLVYKKEYLSNSKSRQNISSYWRKTMFKMVYQTSILIASEPISSSQNISKSSSSETINRDKRRQSRTKKKKQEELVSTDFKIQAMKTILDFIKDDMKSVLEYPNLSDVQSTFLYTLLSSYDKPDDGTEKSLLLTPLIEALKTYSSKYHFRINKDVTSDESRCITLEKTPKSKSTINNHNDSLRSPSPSVIDYQDLEDWNTDIENSDTTDHRSDGVPDFRNGKNLNKNQRKLRSLFDLVSTEFKMSALQKSLDFFEDDTRASLQFVNLTIHESRFLKCLNSFPLTKKCYFLIEKQCLTLITKLRNVLEPLKQKHKLRIAIYVHQNNKLCDVEMTKMPKRDRWKRNNHERGGDRKCENNIEHQSDRSESISARDKFLKALSVSSDSEDDYDNRVSRSGRLRSRDRADKLNHSKEKNSSKNGIQWQPATTDTVDNANSANDKSEAKGKNRLTKHKTKLLEAMSVPVESDIAMRMMRLMGWEGGALGRRGEGITEPIIPAIELVTGAGLGHSPGQTKKERKTESKKGESRTAVNFRKDFLDNVLDLLRKQDITEKEVVYERPLSSKEKRFTTSSLEALNKRRKVGLNTTEEKDSVCRILANLNQMKTISLSIEFSDNDRQMNIIKISSVSKRKTKRPPPPPSEKLSEDESSETVTTLDGNTVTIDDLKKTMTVLFNKKTSNHTAKAVKNHALKRIILNRILDFVGDKDTLTLELKFEEMLTSKQCKYFESVIVNLNKKMRYDCGGTAETKIYAKIKMAIDCLLKLTICERSYRTMTIQKMYYQKRFINTANIKSKTPPIESKSDNRVVEIDSESESIDLKNQNSHAVIDTDVESTIDPDLLALDQDIAAIEHDLMIDHIDRSLTPDSDILHFDDQIESTRDVSKIDNTVIDNNVDSKSVDNTEILCKESVYKCKSEDLNDEEKMKIEDNNSNSGDDFGPELSPSSSKRSREDSDSSEVQISKKSKVYMGDILKVNIAIVPTNYPERKLDVDAVKAIQGEVIAAIDSITENDIMPYLKCQGIIDGALKFVCKNYDSYLWLKKKVSELALPDLELKLIPFTDPAVGGDTRKMIFRVRSYMKEDVRRILNRIEKINKNISTKDWIVLNESWDENNAFLIAVLEMREHSYYVLEKQNFSIYSGFDVGVFTEI